MSEWKCRPTFIKYVFPNSLFKEIGLITNLDILNPLLKKILRATKLSRD